MKLVDILARELKEWPEGCSYCEQDYDHEVRFSHSDRHDFFADELADRDQESAAADGIPHTGKVTRAQWQAAVDALKAGEQVWDGEGLPPVGTVCEVNDKRTESWSPVDSVLAHTRISGLDVAVFQMDYYIAYSPAERFRPIRTAEQIAAEERENAIDEMVQFFMNYYGNPKGAEQYFLICRSLYDAGYRKQVQP